VPIFEFVCPSCGATIEDYMSYDASEKADVMPCVCQPGVFMSKKFPRNTAVKYNCTGFYHTDSKEWGKKKVKKRRSWT